MPPIWVRVNQLENRIELKLKDRLSHTNANGLTAKQVHILHALMQRDGLRPTDLGHKIGLEVAVYTPFLKTLCQKGYVESRAHSGNKREVQIYLTEKGESVRDAICDAVEYLEAYFGEMFVEVTTESEPASRR